ncbi:PAS domain S-box protein [Halopenitus salinus]|uniref:histidine kinase n=1 Tax=Halopenitus salinus TaxID=1198295 RepID=A0ABD5UV67_9EURY
MVGEGHPGERGFPERSTSEVDPRSFPAVVESAGHSIYCTDPDGEIVYVNAAFEEQTGYDAEEALGRNASLLQSGVHDEAFYADLWETILDGDVWTGEIVNERKDGERYTVRQTISPIVDEDGEIAQFVAVNEDVTEIHEYQAELEAERDRFAALLDAVPAPLALVSFEESDSGPLESTVKGVNEAFLETFGGTERELIGEPLDEHIVTDDESNRSRKINEVLGRGEPVREEVVRETPRDGERTFVLEARPFGTDAKEALATYTDITERKRAEERRRLVIEVSRAIREAETFREGLQRTLRTICSFTEWTCGEAWMPDGDGETLEYLVGHTNVEACRRFIDASRTRTFPAGEGLPGRVYASGTDEWIPDVSAVPEATFHRTALASEVGIRAGFGVPLVTEDGVVAVLVFFLRDRRDHDERLVEDVSDVVESVSGLVLRKRAEELLRRQNERLREFADVLSHDLRNPLNVAEGHLELLRSSSEPDDRTDHIEAIETAHARMEELIDDVLLLAREGKAVEEASAIDLSECVSRAWENTETGDASLDIRTSRHVRADESRLRRLFGNLIRNSVEHGSTGQRSGAREGEEHGSVTTDHGPLTVTVGDLPGGFYVADDGPGIPEEKRERVFASGYTSREGGTGLGLAIVREIAEAHGWEVTTTESVDGGARFEVTGVDFVE